MINQILLCFMFLMETVICLHIYGLSFWNLEAPMMFSAPQLYDKKSKG